MPKFNIQKALNAGFEKEEIIDIMVDEGLNDDEIRQQFSSIATPEQQEPSLLSKFGEGIKDIGRTAVSTIVNPKQALIGAGKGLAKAGRPIVEFAEKLTPDFTQPATDLTPEQQAKAKAGLIEGQQQFQEAITPKTEGEARAQAGGSLLGKTAAGAALAATAPISGAGILPVLATGALANAPFALSAIDDGGLEAGLKDVAVNTLFDIATFGAGKALKPLKDVVSNSIGKAFQSFGKKITTSKIKPSKKLVSQGYDTGNFFKYDVDAPTLTGTAKKLSNKIKSTSDKLKNVLGESPAKVDINIVADDAIENFIQKAQKGDQFARDAILESGGAEPLREAIAKLTDEALSIFPDANLNLLDANSLKRSVGTQGAWYVAKDKSSTAEKNAANILYGELRKAINKAAGETGSDLIQKANKELSELIPLERAIIDRLPVASRNEVLPLKAAIALSQNWTSPKQVALALATFGLTSPAVGSKFYKAGQGKGLFTPKPLTPALTGTTAGGIRRQIQEDISTGKQPINLEFLGKQKLGR
jgi:hypothetical protein